MAAPAQHLRAPAPALNLTPTDLALLGGEHSLFSSEGSAAVVLWLRGPVNVPRLPTPELKKLYDKVKVMCCILHDTPSLECINRSPGSQMLPS